ncbi:hypothetical protein DESC_460116 [Desulfosarcina cetonica]|nr:hypothetical protein DESC_460116 [Desulfosarcina cetonica]
MKDLAGHGGGVTGHHGLGVQCLGGDKRHFGPRMAAVHEKNDGLVAVVQVEQARVRRLAGHLGKIQAAGEHIGDQVGGITDAGFHLDAGVALHEDRQQVHDEVVAGQADGQVSAGQRTGGGQRLFEVVQQAEDGPGFDHQAFSQPAEFQLTAVTPEQLDAMVLLQPAQLDGNGRLGQAEVLGRAGKGSGLGQGVQGFELVQIHAGSSPNKECEGCPCLGSVQE